jgi:transposase
MKAEILVGPERRRRWSAEERARIVAEASAPEARVADIARRHGVSRSLIYTWRREWNPGLSGDGRGVALPELVPVVVSGAGSDLFLAVRESREPRLADSTVRRAKIVVVGSVVVKNSLQLAVRSI